LTMMTDLEETLENADRGMTSTNLSSVSNFDVALTADVAAISRIDAVASILEIVCRTTEMGFAAVARVTRDHWVARAVRDEIAFGLLRAASSTLRRRSATKFVITAEP
jgi:hypothetical protein